MRVRNGTPFDVQVQIAAPRGERLASVIIKATYDLRVDGGAQLATDQMPLVTKYLPTSYGTFHGEIFFRKLGVDICVLGTLERDRLVTRASAFLHVGELSFGLNVTGDRTWVRGPRGELVPSDPVPFREMPIGYDRAMGGHQRFEDGSEVLFADNPSGRGYYEHEAQAEHRPLPNIEQVGMPPLQSFQDQTPVAGWGPYPSFWGLRARKSVPIDKATNRVQNVSPSLFNHAHPVLVFDTLPAGRQIRVAGLKAHDLKVRVPQPPASVKARVGREMAAVPAPIDGIFLWCDDSKLVLTQRARFAYDVQSEEHREVQVDLAVAGWS
jgi:hypothetical protein